MPPAPAAAPEAMRIAPPVQDDAESFEPAALDDLPLAEMPHTAIPSIDAFLSALSAEAAAGSSTHAIGAPRPGRGGGKESGSLTLPPEYSLDDEQVSDPGKTSEPLAGSAASATVSTAHAPERDADPVSYERPHLVAADPFEEPFLGGGRRPASPEPLVFDEGPDVIKDIISDDIRAPETAPYAESPTIDSTSAPVVSSGHTTGGNQRLTPSLGIPLVAPAPNERPVGPARMRVARGTPQRVTPIMSMRTVTPMSTPVIPRTPVVPATPVRSPTPIGVSSLTPRSIPALVDIANARAAAEALESVAASIRAGHLIVPGSIPGGTEPEAHAAALAAVLAALLGVRH